MIEEKKDWIPLDKNLNLEINGIIILTNLLGRKIDKKVFKNNHEFNIVLSKLEKYGFYPIKKNGWYFR